MSTTALWVVLSLAVANLVLAGALVVRFIERIVRATRKGISRPIGLGFLASVAMFTLSAACWVAITSAGLAGAAGPQEFLNSWGTVFVTATVLVVLVAITVRIPAVIDSLIIAERALEILVGAVHPVAAASADILSQRERQVLAVMATGKTSDVEIADELIISPATAATHVRNILLKTELHDRRSLVLMAFREGLDDPAED
jgi:DNA-binding CsgD family transcriptional regulator